MGGDIGGLISEDKTENLGGRMKNLEKDGTSFRQSRDFAYGIFRHGFQGGQYPE